MIDAAKCPPLRGSRLTLEPLLATHAEAMFALLDDDELWRYTDRLGLKSAEALRDRYRLLEKRRSPDGEQLWLNWAVVADGEGLTGFVQASVWTQRREAVIGYAIGRRFWSMGIGTEAAGVMLDYLRDGLDVRRVIAYVDERNAASLGLLAKLGFTVTDRADKANYRLEWRRNSAASRP